MTLCSSLADFPTFPYSLYVWATFDTFWIYAFVNLDVFLYMEINRYIWVDVGFRRHVINIDFCDIPCVCILANTPFLDVE